MVLEPSSQHQFIWIASSIPAEAVPKRQFEEEGRFGDGRRRDPGRDGEARGACASVILPTGTRWRPISSVTSSSRRWISLYFRRRQGRQVGWSRAEIAGAEWASASPTSGHVGRTDDGLTTAAAFMSPPGCSRRHRPSPPQPAGGTRPGPEPRRRVEQAVQAVPASEVPAEPRVSWRAPRG